MNRTLSSTKRRSGFSLIELLVTMALLTVIVLGLMIVFNQTQRAFKLGMAQVDILEGGRAAMDLIVSDVEEMTAIQGKGTNTVNAFIAVQPGTPLAQQMPGGSAPRVNVLQDFFLLSRENQEIIGTGYTVLNAQDGMGSLYRFTTNVHVRNYDALFAFTPGLFSVFDQVLTDFPTNSLDRRLSHLLDGVVHFRVLAYATNGVLLDPFYDDGVFPSIDVWYDANNADEFRYRFRDDALPTAVEVELGILEEDVVKRAKALPAGAIRRQYLEKEAGKVHIFRKRIPIRRADPQAYR